MVPLGISSFSEFCTKNYFKFAKSLVPWSFVHLLFSVTAVLLLLHYKHWWASLLHTYPGEPPVVCGSAFQITDSQQDKEQNINQRGASLTEEDVQWKKVQQNSAVDLVGTSLAYNLVQTLLSPLEPVPSHSEIGIEFADDCRWSGSSTLGSIHLLYSEDGCFSNRKSVAQFKQLRLLWRAIKNLNAKTVRCVFVCFFYPELINRRNDQL